MTMTLRRLLLWFALAALALAPTITGAMPVIHGARYLPYAVLVFSIFSFSFTQSRRFKRLALLWWRDDTHWNAVGQRVAAEAIYRLHGRDAHATGEDKR
jgi:hypothetical protein